MKENNFERELPSGYKQVEHLNAKGAKLGIVMNLIAFAIMLVIMAIAVALCVAGGRFSFPDKNFPELFGAWLCFVISMVLYIVLHELVHGIAYKALTGEKLTFGFSWSCAFCGVPNVYTYRKTALIAVSAPLIVFTLILIPIVVIFYFVNVVYYFIFAFVLGLHLGGCVGDIYVMYLLAIKHKSKKTLMRDTGPEMTIYTIEE